jgi:hypothetical protein
MLCQCQRQGGVVVKQNPALPFLGWPEKANNVDLHWLSTCTLPETKHPPLYQPGQFTARRRRQGGVGGHVDSAAPESRRQKNQGGRASPYCICRIRASVSGLPDSVVM